MTLLIVKKQLNDYSVGCFPIKGFDERPFFALAEATYGDVNRIKQRWQWECVDQPFIGEIKIYVAETGSSLIGASIRLPFTLSLESRRITSAFSVNSMVHPNYRRMGIMEKLYQESFKQYPVLFSKGTMPGMYRLLLKMGYRPLLPNTTLVAVLSLVKWIAWRAGIFRSNPSLALEMDIADQNYRKVTSFGGEFDEFWERSHKAFRGTVVKNLAHMNWRYFDIPHRRYAVFYRYEHDKIVACIVLGSSGSTGKIVDLLWDHEQTDEPLRSIRFAKSYLKKCGFMKASCWCTYGPLRKALKRMLFVDRGETPHFSYISNDDSIQLGNDAHELHFVEGDGDAEYLG